jgi:hypothetical protein
MAEKDISCPCGECDYTVVYEKRGKKLEPVYCPFCGADAEEDLIEELEEDEDE